MYDIIAYEDTYTCKLMRNKLHVSAKKNSFSLDLQSLVQRRLVGQLAAMRSNLLRNLARVSAAAKS